MFSICPALLHETIKIDYNGIVKIPTKIKRSEFPEKIAKQGAQKQTP
jgi:hypothetical protein